MTVIRKLFCPSAISDGHCEFIFDSIVNLTILTILGNVNRNNMVNVYLFIVQKLFNVY